MFIENKFLDSCTTKSYKEIEKKFLLSNKLPPLHNGIDILQVYIFINDYKEMRVRIKDGKCMITIKFNFEHYIREEFEYEIPLEDGQRIISNGSKLPPILKTRYKVIEHNTPWSIDIFHQQNEGLILAEVELNETKQKFVKPYWLGEEVTNERKYYNANLYSNPYKNW